MMDPTDATERERSCTVCGHRNVLRAQFCARCGQSLTDGTMQETPDADPSQTTSVFVPISPAPAEAAWAEPEAQQTTALPVRTAEWSPSPSTRSAPKARSREGYPRGLLLGTLASMIIIAELGLYLYTAWLSPSIREELTGWLPW